MFLNIKFYTLKTIIEIICIAFIPSSVLQSEISKVPNSVVSIIKLSIVFSTLFFIFKITFISFSISARCLFASFDFSFILATSSFIKYLIDFFPSFKYLFKLFTHFRSLFCPIFHSRNHKFYLQSIFIFTIHF